MHLVRTDVLRDAARLARDDVRVADAVEQRGLAVVDVAHHRDDRRARLEQRLVVFLVVVGGEHRDELDLLLAARLDDQHLRAERLGDQLDHLVGERRGRRDHLARFEQDADEVGRRAVQLGRVLLDGAAARDDDLAFGDGRVGRREPLRRRFELGYGRDDASCAGAGADHRDGRGRRDRHRTRRDRHRDRRRDRRGRGRAHRSGRPGHRPDRRRA